MTLSLSVFICMVYFYYSTGISVQGVVPFMANKSNENDPIEEVPETTTPLEENKKNHCFCTKIYDPVCGSDNKSYYNLCQLECQTKPANVTVQHQGNCIPYR